MKKIYIILMHTHTIPSRLVKILTFSKYTHVAISLDKSCNTIYSLGRKNFNSILHGGFSIQEKNGKFFNKFNNTICKIFEIEVSDKQYYAISNIIDDMIFCSDKYKYDFLGAVIRYFRIPVSCKNKYVCSSFIAYLLENSNVYKFNKKTCFVQPKDFEYISSFKEIYTGVYRLYCDM